MKENPYYLHAIVIHDGKGNYGHYYAFIFDRKAEKWYRFNDYKITEESEENVLKEGYGDPNSKASAYCLIYINNEIANSLSKITLSEHNLNL